MTVGGWVLGVACLAGIAIAPFLGARRLVRRLAPGVAGAPALLASVILTLTLVTLVSELAGSVGQFRRWPLVVGCLLVGAVAARAGRPNLIRAADHDVDRAILMAGALAVAVGARWAIGSGTSLRSGIFTEDSIQYHLPFAATFAQSGWLSRIHYAWLDPVWSFYPYGSEVFHAIGMVALGNDVLSPVLNLGWLGLLLLAAWCCGDRWKAGTATLAVGALLACLPMLTLSQPGSANSDVACLALLVSAVALLLSISDSSGGYLLAALAAGLAASTTLYALPPVAGLAVGVLLFDKRRVPGKFRLGALGLILAGSYWYLRNLIIVGNPVPGFKVGPLHLPAPAFPIVARYGFSVAHYMPHPWFWEHYVRPGLHYAFGPGWPVVAALALAGTATALSGLAPSLFRPVCFGSAVAAIVYLLTPTSAYGPPGNPVLFAANLRFLLPSVAWLSVLGGIGLSRHLLGWMGQRIRVTGPAQSVWVGLVVVLGLVTLAYPYGIDRQWTKHPLFAVIGAAVAVMVLALALVRRAHLRAAGIAAFVVAGVAAGLPVSDSYVAHRYTADGPIYRWAHNIRGARIGTVAFAEQYPLFGLHLDDEVSYAGTASVNHSILVAANCGEWRRQLAQGRYDFVVIGDNDWTSAPIPQLAWTESDPGATAMVVTRESDPGPHGVVFRLRAGAGTTAGC